MKKFRKLFKSIERKTLRDLSQYLGFSVNDTDKVEDHIDYIVNKSENNEEFDVGYYCGVKDMIRIFDEILKKMDRPLDTLIEYNYRDEMKNSQEESGKDFEDQELIEALLKNKTYQDWIKSGFVEIEDHIIVSIMKLKHLDKFVDMDLFKGHIGYGVEI